MAQKKCPCKAKAAKHRKPHKKTLAHHKPNKLSMFYKRTQTKINFWGSKTNPKP